MRIALFSPIIILVLTTLPTSLSAPPISRLNADLVLDCLSHLPDPFHPTTRHCIAPFLSHCLYLAQELHLEPGANDPLVFDRRPLSPTLTRLAYPYRRVHETCWVQFAPPAAAPSGPPNLVSRALFADAIVRTIDICFAVGPGQESEDHVAAKMHYESFVGRLFGYSVPNRVGSENVTAVEGGLNGTELAEAWASLNGSAVELVEGQSGTADTGRVDVI